MRKLRGKKKNSFQFSAKTGLSRQYAFVILTIHAEMFAYKNIARRPLLRTMDVESGVRRERENIWSLDVGHCNEVNSQLQGDNLNLIETKSIIAAFPVRINLVKNNLGRREFSQFSKLSNVNCQNDDISAYVQHLNVLRTDFKIRF